MPEKIYNIILVHKTKFNTSLFLVGILKNSKLFLMDGTFSAAPSFNYECRQSYVIMGITFNTVSCIHLVSLNMYTFEFFNCQVFFE